MVKYKLATIFMMLILIGLVLSCSHVEQIDHDDPVKPKETRVEIVHRLKHVNGSWYHVSSPVKQIATK